MNNKKYKKINEGSELSLEIEDIKRILKKKKELDNLIELSSKRMKEILNEGYEVEGFKITKRNKLSWKDTHTKDELISDICNYWVQINKGQTLDPNILTTVISPSTFNKQFKDSKKFLAEVDQDLIINEKVDSLAIDYNNI